MAAIFDKYTDMHPNLPVAKIRPDVMKKRFLDLYPLVASTAKTCEVLGICPRIVYHWKKEPEFLEAFQFADTMALGMLEDEAVLRAMYGVDRPVYQSGKLVGYIKEYSDTLLIVLLKARAPHKYKERFSGELTGADGKPLGSEHKIIHVHSSVPIAQMEEAIDMKTYTPFEEVPKTRIDDIDELLK